MTIDFTLQCIFQLCFKQFHSRVQRDRGISHLLVRSTHPCNDKGWAGLGCRESWKLSVGSSYGCQGPDDLGIPCSPPGCELAESRDQKGAGIPTQVLQCGLQLQVVSQPLHELSSLEELVRSQVLGRYAHHGKSHANLFFVQRKHQPVPFHSSLININNKKTNLQIKLLFSPYYVLGTILTASQEHFYFRNMH